MSYALIGLLLVVVNGFVAYQVWEKYKSRDDVLQDRTRELTSISNVLSDHAAQHLRLIEHSLTDLAATARLPENLHGALPDSLLSVGYVRNFFVVDRDGRLARDSQDDNPPPIDLSDRDYFIAHASGRGPAVLVGTPILSRKSGTWFIPVSRRVDDEGGNFAGVVVATVDPALLAAFYSSVNVGRDGAVALFNTDGVLLARSPRRDDLIGRSFADSRLFAELLPESEHGSYETRTTVDGIQRIGSYHAVPGTPLVIALSFGIDETLAEWRRDGLSLATMAAFVFIVSVSLFALLGRELRNRDRMFAALRVSESRFADFARTASDWMWETDHRHRFVWFGERIPAQDEANAIQLFGKTRWEMGWSEKSPEKWAAHKAVLDRHEPFRNFEYSIRLPDDRIRHVRVSGAPCFSESGAFTGYRGTTTDVTAEVEARREATEAKARLLDAINSLSDGFATFDKEDRLIIHNRTFRESHSIGKVDLTGLTFEEFTDRVSASLVDCEATGMDWSEWTRWRLAHHRNPSEPLEVKYRDGRWIRVLENKTGDGGRVLVRTDITALKLRESELNNRAAQQNAIANLSQLAIQEADLQRLMQRAADLVQQTLDMQVVAVRELSGDGAELIRRASTGPASEGMSLIRVPADARSIAGLALTTRSVVSSCDLHAERTLQVHPALVSAGLRSAISVVIEAGERPFGTLTGFSDRVRIFQNEDIYFVQAIANVLANAIEVRRQQTRLGAILDNSVDSILSIDENGVILSANASVFRMFGYAERELLGRKITVLMARQHREWHARQIQDYVRTGESQLLGRGRELEALSKDGRIFPVEAGARGVAFGSQRMFIVSIRDLTQRKEVEQKLQQVQKAEAIGQLTGGMAHDFNNLLTVIIGNGEHISERTEQASDLHRAAEMILAAARRGAAVVERLLAFARRQTLDVSEFDINHLVEGMTALLKHTLGEQVTIRLSLSDCPLIVSADRGQLENAILNLVINARDGMPSGGTLTIHTSLLTIDQDYTSMEDVDPGAYVQLAVTDTGVGIPREILPRVFDPFFTTKEVGKGSGLGLSMVYGFAKQSGGYVKIYSEVGHGTTVKVFLPLANGSAQIAKASHSSPNQDLPRGDGMSVLLVEDDELVRRFAVAELQRLGYRVIEAEHGAAALSKLDAERDIDLLFTDVIMPGGVGGRDLAKRARELRPKLKILYTTGYADGAFMEVDMRSDGIDVLRKPYSRTELARRVFASLHNS